MTQPAHEPHIDRRCYSRVLTNVRLPTGRVRGPAHQPPCTRHPALADVVPPAPPPPASVAAAYAMSKKEDAPVEEPQLDDEGEESDEYDVEVTAVFASRVPVHCLRSPALSCTWHPTLAPARTIDVLTSDTPPISVNAGGGRGGNRWFRTG